MVVYRTRTPRLYSPSGGFHVCVVTPSSQLDLFTWSVTPNMEVMRFDFPLPGRPSTKILMFLISCVAPYIEWLTITWLIVALL